MSISYAVISGVQQFFRLLSLLILVDVLISWFLPPNNGFRAFLDRLIQPLLNPFRPLGTFLMRYGLPLDLTPIVAIIVLNLAESIIIGVLLWVIRI